MTIILLTEIESILDAFLTQIVDILPALMGIWLVFYFIRSLFFKD